MILDKSLTAFLAAATTGLAVLGLAPQGAQAQEVFVGSANGWRQMIDHPEQWRYVRANANGYYVNFIELLHADAPTMAKLSPLFTHRDAYFESDSRYTGLGGFPDGGQFTRALQAKEMSSLLDGGFTVPYTSLNYGFDDPKADDLRHQGLTGGKTRPCFAQYGPWEFDGDLAHDFKDNARIRREINRAEGATTDGPLSLWKADQGKMRAGSFSLVKYAHGLRKTAAVMVSPYDLKPRSLWLAAAQECVRQHEDAGARPDIWIVFEYATDTPTLPETDADGKPANTITGMAFWLLHHLEDPDHYARIAAPKSLDAHGGTFTVRNTGPDIDLCPVVTARIDDPRHAWNVRFTLGGADVTDALTSKEGLAFVRDLRLYPGDTRQIIVTFQRRPAARADAKPPTVTLTLRPN